MSARRHLERRNRGDVDAGDRDDDDDADDEAREHEQSRDRGEDDAAAARRAADPLEQDDCEDACDTQQKGREVSAQWRMARGRCGCTAAGSGRTADDVDSEPHPLLPRDLLHAIQELGHPRALDLALRLHLDARIGAFRVAHQRARARRLVVAAARRVGARVDPTDAVRLHLRVGLRQPRRRALAVLRVGRRRRVGTAALGAAVLDKLAPLAVAPRHAARRRVVTEVEAEVLHHRQSDRRDRRPPAVPAVELRAARHENCAEDFAPKHCAEIRIARAAHDMTSSRITRVSQCDARPRSGSPISGSPCHLESS